MKSSTSELQPQLSVVMPVYNGGPLAVDAARSILGQTMTNLELIVIDDGSTDGSVAAIVAIGDHRIRIVRHPFNQGLARSFNDGIIIARAPLLARMDADDIAEPDRMAVQSTFMDAHPDISVVGSWVRVIDADGQPKGLVKRPATTVLLKWHALFSTPLIHPTVMARTTVLRENPYLQTLTKSEDYELWSRLLWDRGMHIATIPRPLLRYRQWPLSTTNRLNAGRGSLSADNTLKNLRRYIVVSPRKEIAFLRLKGDGRISPGDWFCIMATYTLVLLPFVRCENPSVVEIIEMTSYLPRTAFRLARRLVHVR